jgi:release factor glutamine methyltransferase
MSSTEAWTVGRLLTWTADYLKKEGSGSPRLDAEVLLAHARKCSRVQLYTAYEEVADEEQRASFREMVKLRASGMPVAYLVGYKEFYSARFEVTPDVLIPRPETEHLVLAALDCAKQLRLGSNRQVETTASVAEASVESRSLTIADVCTGSGIIAITLAKHLSDCRVLATDISPAALDVARRNAALHQLDESRVSFWQGDLLGACPADVTFDLILSNPPYVSEAEYEQLDKSVRDFEPKLALVAGQVGGEIIQRLIAESAARLRSGGYLIFEFSPMLADRLNTWLGPEWLEPKIVKDYAGLSRIVLLQRQ